MMSGSALAQVTGYALAPVISRLFTAADFGVLGTFGAMLGVATAFVTLDYSQAVMLPSRSEEAGEVFVLSCLVTVAVSAGMAGLILVKPEWLQGVLRTDHSWLAWLLVLATLGGGLSASFQAWCVRLKSFRTTSAGQAVRGLSSNGFQVVLGLLHTGAPGLILSSVVGEVCACMVLFRAVRHDLRGFVASVRWKSLRRSALEYRDFPAYSATQNLLNALSIGLPVLLLTQFYGIAVAGAYAFGMRLLNAPMSLISGALRQVLFQKAGETQHAGRSLLPLFLQTTLSLFAIGFLPALTLGLVAPRLFAWIFGSEWLLAGELARYLVFWLLFTFCNVPAVLVARLIRMQRTVFFYNLALLAARLLTLVAGGWYLSALQTVLLFSVVGAVMNLLLIVLVLCALLRNEDRHDRDCTATALLAPAD